MIPLGIITIPDGKARTNISTGAAILDLGGLGDGSIDAVVRAVLGGIAGDDITVAATGDTGAGVRVSIVGQAVTILYHSGVSTEADLEAALVGNALISVDVPGTGATVLTAPGANFAATHLASGAAGAFTVPRTTQAIYLLAAAAGVTYRSAPDAATLSTVTAGSADFPLAAGQAFGENVSGYGNPIVVAAYNGGGSPTTVSIYGVQS